jgi:hypothetical protein
MGPEVILRGNNPQGRTSALGHKRTLQRILVMSALPPKATFISQNVASGSIPLFMIASDARAEARNSISCLDFSGSVGNPRSFPELSLMASTDGGLLQG